MKIISRTSYDYSDETYPAIVTGARHCLEIRNNPSHRHSSIIGTLHNGDEVEVADYRKGRYIYIYSPNLNCSGWVNGNYVA